MPKPKSANGLHFVWGAIFLLGGGGKLPQSMPGYIPGGYTTLNLNNSGLWFLIASEIFVANFLSFQYTYF